MTITLEAIKAEQDKVAAMIAAFEAKAKAEAAYPITVALPELNPGERYLGAILSADGSKRHHVILLPGEIEEATCNKAMEWAAGIGGESGPKARPMHPDWARSLRDQCAAAGVPFLFKQWGEWTEEDPGETSHKDCAGVLPSGGVALCSEGYQPPWDTMERLNESGGVRLDGRTLMFHVGKKRAGRLLDGVQHDGYPKGGVA